MKTAGGRGAVDLAETRSGDSKPTTRPARVIVLADELGGGTGTILLSVSN